MRRKNIQGPPAEGSQASGSAAGAEAAFTAIAAQRPPGRDPPLDGEGLANDRSA
ncbi:MAG: hypothetical protein NVSMB47_00640 [Polyangiales bacterium]